MATPLAVFGPGILIVTRTDTTVPVAVNVGFAQELTLDFTATAKELFGQKQYPLVVARGTIKATGKWKAAVCSGIAWNTAFYGQSAFSTSSAVNIAWTIDSTFTVASTAAVQVGSTTTFDADLGVKYAVTGAPLQRVATGSESSGKYSITNTATAGPGSYNFATGDTSVSGGLLIKVTYTSFVASGAGQSLIVTNQLIGTTPTFQLDYYTNLNQPTAKPFLVRLYTCVANKMVIAPKLEDFAMPEFDFGFYANSADQVVNYIFPEIS